MAKKFFFVSLGILALAAAFHLGASTVQSQGSGEVVGIASHSASNGANRVYVGTVCGDVYCKEGGGEWLYDGNAFGAAPSKIDETTWSRVKAEFK